MKALIESIHLNIKHDFNQQDLIEIPIVYGSKYGPDLESLLKHYKIKLETFIELHSKAQYFCFDDGIFTWVSLFNWIK